MNVREKFSTTGLFQTINIIQPLKYMGLISPKTMDILYISNNGMRKLSYLGENNTVEEIANILVEMFASKWDKLYDVATSEIPIDYNYEETTTEKVDDSGTNNNDFISTNTNLVNAYNDDDFVNDKKDDTKTTNIATVSNTKNREYKKQILQGSKTDNLEKVKNYLQNNYFNDIIIRDIKTFITLSIFD